jgi:alcohol dehydrogenase
MLKETDIGQIVHRTIDQMNALAVKEFRVPPDTHIGPGAIARIGEALHRRGIARVFVVIDEIVEHLGLAAGMYRAFDAHGIEAVLHRQPPGEPCSDVVEETAKALSAARAEGVVALGGGSAIDAAKATAVLAANPDYCVADLVEPGKPWRRRLPLIAVPTTAGTGSEATNVSVITDAGSRRKRVIAHTDLVPDLALIDACLTLEVPPRFTAITGVDALTHAIEAYVATHATPLTKALAYRAAHMIGDALPIAVGKGSDVAAREEMALASYMAGIAFSNAGLGLCHALAHRIGPAYGLPHGLANAVMLPSVMQFNVLVCKKSYADIGLALSGTILSAEEAIRHIQRLIVEVGLPGNLAAVGGRAEDFGAFADEALLDVCIESNPRTVSREQIIGVYQHACAR